MHNGHAAVEKFEIFRFVGRAEQVGVGGVRLLRAHFVFKPLLHEILGHLFASTELVNELLIKPRLVHAQVGVREQTVAIEPLDVVALIGAAVAPNVYIVFTHCRHEHGARDRATERRGVEIRLPAGGDVKRTTLNGGNALGDELVTAIHQPRLFGAVLHGFAGNVVVIRLVGLSQVGRVGKRNCSFRPHPMQSSAGIQPAREGNSHFLAHREALQNRCHEVSP